MFTWTFPKPFSFPGTFALTSLISANAVERLVPQSSRNLTTQSNSSVLGLSDFELQRIGVAAAVSFLGGVIQVSSFETAEDRGDRNKGRASRVAFGFLTVGFSPDVFYDYGNISWFCICWLDK